MKLEDVDKFEKTEAKLKSLYEEMITLSKKNPDNAINKFKLKFINQILIEVNDFLDVNYRPFTEFEIFDENSLPTNSDVVMILSQYIECFEKFRCDNIHQSMGRWYWNTENTDKKDERQTFAPLKFKR